MFVESPQLKLNVHEKTNEIEISGDHLQFVIHKVQKLLNQLKFVNYPKYWANKIESVQTGIIKKIEVKVNSEEYNNVLSKDFSLSCHFKVDKIERIQNPALWAKFEQEC